MKIYLVERTDKWSCDDYDSFVCFANSEEEARYLSPSDYYVWKDNCWHFKFSNGKTEPRSSYGWTNDPKTLKVFELSRDPQDGKAAVILASFNPG